MYYIDILEVDYEYWSSQHQSVSRQLKIRSFLNRSYELNVRTWSTISNKDFYNLHVFRCGYRTWKLLIAEDFPAVCSLLLTHWTISFSMMGLPVLASRVSTDSVYARISCQISAEVRSGGLFIETDWEWMLFCSFLKFINWIKNLKELTNQAPLICYYFCWLRNAIIIKKILHTVANLVIMSDGIYRRRLPLSIGWTVTIKRIITCRIVTTKDRHLQNCPSTKIAIWRIVTINKMSPAGLSQ